jgi:hypothetical protein
VSDTETAAVQRNNVRVRRGYRHILRFLVQSTGVGLHNRNNAIYSVLRGQTGGASMCEDVEAAVTYMEQQADKEEPTSLAPSASQTDSATTSPGT